MTCSALRLACVMLPGIVLAACSAWETAPGSAVRRGDQQLSCEDIAREILQNRNRMADLLSGAEAAEDDGSWIRADEIDLDTNALKARNRVLQKLARGKDCSRQEE